MHALFPSPSPASGRGWPTGRERENSVAINENITTMMNNTPTPQTRVPLLLPRYFSWRAVALVMAEKFGLRGLRIAVMVLAPVSYFWWKQCNSFLCVLLYVAAAAALLSLILMVWTAKEALDKFAVQHAQDAWLVLNDEGVGGESGAARFLFPWDRFRRVVERGQCWLLETRQGAWMVLPTTQFTREAWAIMRAHRCVPLGKQRK